jgi:hypothetical protein
MMSSDVTAWEIVYAVLRVPFFWPLYALLNLCFGMHLKMWWVEHRVRKSLGEPSPYQTERQPQIEIVVDLPSIATPQ